MLLFNVHHIASDGRSGDILVEEFITQYEAIRTGRADPLPPLTIRYADYAHWQRNWLTGAVLERQLGYWERQLLDLPPVHSLPLSRPRPAQASFKGARHPFHIDAATHQALKRLAQERQATLFMVLHAAVSILLSRHSNSTDIVIGTPVANRMQKELEDIIGFFVNTLVLRADCAGNPRFTDYLERIKAVNLEAQSNQDVPFEYLVERLKPERSTQYSPLFQVLFAMGVSGGEKGGSIELPDVRFTPVMAAEVGAKYELLFDAREMADGIAFHIDYNTDLFDSASVVRMAQHLGILLDGIVADPQTPIHALPLLSEDEQHYLLHTLNATQAAYPQDKCIHELFESQVEKTPNSTAVVYEGEQLTYAELNDRANRLAHYLREQGVQADTLVGLCVERGLEMMVSLLGVLKTGGAYVPLDSGYPRERLAYMIEDSGVELLLTQRTLQEKVGQLAGRHSRLRIVSLDGSELQSTLQRCPASNPYRSPHQSSRNLAYVIYTSGSTGQPKGVMVEHRGVANLAMCQRAMFGATERSRVLCFASLSFDAAIFEWLMAAFAGAVAYVCSERQKQNPAALESFLIAHRITHATLPPAVLLHLNSERNYSLETLILAGEACTEQLVQPWLERYKVFNAYGPTESTVWSSTAALQRHQQITIGRPIANTQFYVLDGYLNPVPQGVPGELHIGGVGLARGYLHRPELTEERFIDHPFQDRSDSVGSARLYKTGDLVRYVPNGDLEYLGRIDDQVKIRGFRIELGEIEARLAQHPAVKETVVLARQDGPDGAAGKRLVAYYTSEEVELTAEALRAHVLEVLPDYMAPAAYVQLDKLPLTRNGKIDKKALPAPEASLVAIEYVAPQTSTEEQLIEICAQLLQLKPEEISTTANFFALGGHSLLVVQLLSAVQKAGMAADAQMIFSAPSLRALAAALDEGASAEHSSFSAPANLIPPACDRIEPRMLPLVSLSEQEIERIVATVPGGARNVQDIYPLAPLQEGILFSHLMHRNNDPYILRALFAVSDQTQFEALMGALQRVVDRHDVLRTAVVSENISTPVQVVYRHADLAVEALALDPTQDAMSQMKARF
ncbi:MAG TPA: amino acid adenylation domain-containing protein, partial [Steroidobacter sp.]|uniref:non-ribosomal peptide synthetase n=1 Tax=Steroidobacter sp. TaxID=1978227 RepID=UPI002ED9E14C